MRLLITGGCGFLGSNIAAHALARGDELTIFDNLSRIGATRNLEWLGEQGTFNFVHGEIRSQSDVFQVVAQSKPQAIFHLAGQVAMATSIRDPRRDFEINAIGTLNLLEAVRANVPEAAVIYSSTNKVYGDLEQFTYRETETRYECVEYPKGFDESLSIDFRTPYGCSKGTADQYMLDYARTYKLNTVVFRHSSMYGGRQFATYDQGWIGWFCLKAVECKRGILKEPFTISGNGKQVRDLLHAEDMIRLYFSCVECIANARGHAFNIGGGIENSLSLLELFTMLEDALGVKLKYTTRPQRQSDQKVFVADWSRINDIALWRPQVRRDDGILKMVQWTYSILK